MQWPNRNANLEHNQAQADQFDAECQQAASHHSDIQEAEGEEETTKNDSPQDIDIQEEAHPNDDHRARNMDESVAVVVPSDTQSQ